MTRFEKRAMFDSFLTCNSKIAKVSHTTFSISSMISQRKASHFNHIESISGAADFEPDRIVFSSRSKGISPQDYIAKHFINTAIVLMGARQTNGTPCSHPQTFSK